MGDEGQYGAGSVGERQEGAGGGGDAQPLTLLESASQHAAVTTATVTTGQPQVPDRQQRGPIRDPGRGEIMKFIPGPMWVN